MKKKTIIFNDCLKTFTEDQDKAITPKETLKNFYSKIETLDLEILNEVRRIDNGRLDIPVYFSVCGDDAKALTGTKKQMGKGASPLQAEASACMELAERFSFFAYKDNEENFLTGDYNEMVAAGHPVLELHSLLLSVHDTNTDSDLLKMLLTGIPMQWAWGTNITTGEDILIPFSWFFAINEFNGPSAGNTNEEAALQGICEIIERHVCSVINNKKIKTPKIDPDSVKDPVARDLLEKFSANNIELYLRDFSLDTGLCTVGALAIDRSTFPGKSEIVYTAGTPPEPEKAIIRAVTEIAQLAGDFNSDSNYVASGLPKPLSMEEVDYVTDITKTHSVEDIANISDDNIKTEVVNCVNSIKNIGMDVLMIDVTHDRLNIPAFYTIIPGAHFRERSMINDVGLFSAKLVVELISDPQLLEAKLLQMEELLPNAYYLEFYRGRNYFNIGSPESALGHFESALLKNPQAEDLPYIYSFMGSCLKDLGQYERAIEKLQTGLLEDEERPDLHNTLGVCYFKQEKYEQAIVHFQRAVDLNPASGMDYANLGVNYSKLGETDQAIEFLTIALTIDPELEFAQDLLNRLLTK